MRFLDIKTMEIAAFVISSHCLLSCSVQCICLMFARGNENYLIINFFIKIDSFLYFGLLTRINDDSILSRNFLVNSAVSLSVNYCI